MLVPPTVIDPHFLLADASVRRSMRRIGWAGLLLALGCGGEAPFEPAPVDRLAVTPESATVIVDSLLQLTASPLDSAGVAVEGARMSWSSSDDGVAAVDSTGLVRGVAPGLAVITVAADGASDSAAVTVLPGAASLSVSPRSWAMVRDGSVRLAGTLRDAAGRVLEGRPLTWVSSDTAVAVVDSGGLVTGVGAGVAMVTASREGLSDTAAVTVKVVTFVSVSTGWPHSCGLTSEGEIYCWGANWDGALGNGTMESSAAPARVLSDEVFQYLEVGFFHSCAIAVGGAAYCWGEGSTGELGNGETLSSSIPVRVAGGLTFRQVSPGSDHTCGVTVDDKAYCWGDNSAGQLGDSTSVSSATPVLVAGGHAFEFVSAGLATSCGLTTDGTAYCWGRNGYGELGTGTPGGQSETPVPVSGGRTFSWISVSDHRYVCAVASDGTAYCWGHNDVGMLGRGWESTYEADVAPVSGSVTYAAIDGSAFHTCGLATDGRLYCWGQNYIGLGDGSTTLSSVPVLIPAGPRFASVHVGRYRTCSLSVDGVAYCWGEAPVGDGAWENRATPVRVAGQP
jgi:alpha-tubulin suppressor-like RCC1 family protein